MPRKPVGKPASAGLPRLKRKDFPMRLLFWTWISLIAAGIVFYSVIGLTHH
jgi:hypothetical protein